MRRVAILLACGVSALAGAATQDFEANPDTARDLELHGGATIAAGKAGSGLQLPSAAFAQWRVASLKSSAGTLILWVSPRWSKRDDASHAFLTFRWSGNLPAYFAVSDGWWEPRGARKLFAIVNNQDGLACYSPGTFDYEFFAPQQWTMIAVTWTGGADGYVRLYADGRRLCQRKGRLDPSLTSQSPLYLGSDAGATDQRARHANAVMDDVFVSDRVLTDEEIWRAYLRGVRDTRETWLRNVLATASARTIANEMRVMTDEDPHWLRGPAEIRRTIDRIKAAGFNVYVPCVWNGGEARYRTELVPMARGVADGASSHYDSLRDLIDYAHSKGIEVHPWFIVSRRVGTALPPQFFAGAPEDAYNIHEPAFRAFIARLIGDFASTYDVEGINLDYIRSVGPCLSEQCVGEYQRRFGRSVAEDWKSQLDEARVPSLAAWNAEAMTKIIRDVATAVRAAQPDIKLSIDSVPYDHGRWHQGVDEGAWLGAGLVDQLFVMAYEHPLDLDRISRAAREFGEERVVVLVRNYDQVGDSYIKRSGMEVADFVALKRALWPGSGIGFYHYPHMTPEQLESLRTSAFAPPAVLGTGVSRP